MLRSCFTLSFTLLFLTQSVQARIGESRNQLEGRLLDSGGLLYRDDDIKKARSKGKPYPNLMEYVTGADVRIYFKAADGSSTSSSQLNAKRMPPGWDLHVVFVNGKSVIELYERSRGMTAYELNQLLAIQAGGSYWQRIEKGAEKKPSALGYEMLRADGTVRARKIGGNILLFSDAEFDTKLALAKKEALEENAPLSVEGF